MFIYVDILIITNIYINYFLLKATAKLIHSPMPVLKCIAGACIGSLFSLIILLPDLTPAAILLLRLLTAALMVTVSFGGKNQTELYKTGLIFFFVCFLFAGTEYAFSLLDKGNNFLWHNSVLYINISLLTLVISTITAYAALCVLRRFLDISNEFDSDYTLIVINGSKQTSIKAVIDTCNNLTDPFSGRPVIVCGKKCLDRLFEEKTLSCVTSGAFEDADYSDTKGWRIIPFSTVNSNGLMPSFLPTGIYLKNNENGKIRYVEAYIGIAEQDIDHAVFNPKILGK